MGIVIKEKETGKSTILKAIKIVVNKGHKYNLPPSWQHFLTTQERGR